MILTTGKRQAFTPLHPGKPRPLRQGVTGFTLMEMLVVLAVVAMILGISIPFFSSFNKGTKIKSAVRDITAALNSARTLAITYRKNYSVTFDCSTEPHSYYIADPQGQIYKKRYSLPSALKFYHPASPQSPTTFDAHQAVFSSTGGLAQSASGSVWISDKSGNFRRISVSNTTGRVKVDKEE